MDKFLYNQGKGHGLGTIGLDYIICLYYSRLDYIFNKVLYAYCS